MKLNEKVIFVAVACGPLGQQIVLEILQQNGRVLATDMHTDKVKKLFQVLPSEKVQLVVMDITDGYFIDQAVATGL